MSPRRLAFALASLLALAAAAPAAARPFTAVDLVGLDRASDPHVSPDGRTVAFVLRRTDGEKNRGVTSLMLMDLVGPEHAVMHIGGPEDDGASSPRWSQSGALYFLKQGQVWNTYGEAARACTSRRRLAPTFRRRGVCRSRRRTKSRTFRWTSTPSAFRPTAAA